MTEQTNDLMLLNEADKALALAQSVPELKNLRSAFTAAKAWAKARGMGVESENKASEYILRTERKVGAELIRMAETGERRAVGGNPSAARMEAEGTLTLSQISVSMHQSADWQRLARLPDIQFEALLAHAREARERLAKVNFYRTDKKHDGDPPTPPTPGFDMLRAGAYALLGWKIDEDGQGKATKNGLLDLPNDELLSLAQLVQALIVAYNEVKKVRK